MTNEDRMMEVTDSKGNVYKMYVLFTTSLEEYGKDYVFYTNSETQDGNVFVSSYNEDGSLEDVEDEEEWNTLNEAFSQYMEEQRKNAGGCSGCAGCGSSEGCNCDGDCDCNNN